MARKIKVDFSDVKDFSGISPKHKPEGDYLGKITKVLDDPAKDDTPMLNFLIQLDDDHTAVYPYYCKLSENQLWKLRNLLIASGMKAPKKAMTIDPDRLVGKTLGITLEDDEYEGKMKSVIAATFPAAELVESGAPVEAEEEDDEDVEEPEEVDEEPEEEPEELDEEEEPEEEPEGDEFDGMDRTELKAQIKKLGLGAVRKSESDDDLRERLRNAPDEEDEEDEDEMEVDL